MCLSRCMYIGMNIGMYATTHILWVYVLPGLIMIEIVNIKHELFCNVFLFLTVLLSFKYFGSVLISVFYTVRVSVSSFLSYQPIHLIMFVRACVCVRARARVCVRARARVCVCVCWYRRFFIFVSFLFFTQTFILGRIITTLACFHDEHLEFSNS